MGYIPKYEFSQEEKQRMSENRWLTDKERTVFDLFYRRGWSIERIAAAMDKDGRVYENDVMPPENEITRSTIDRILKSIRQKTMKSL